MIIIDTIYQRVLAIANKEQRGYITPQEFNLLAGKAQLDIFNQYFHDYKTAILSPGNQTKSSDDADLIREKISLHRKYGVFNTDAFGVGVLSNQVHWLESIYKASNTNRVVEITMDSASLEVNSTISIPMFGASAPLMAAIQMNFNVAFQTTTPPAAGNETIIVVLTETETNASIALKFAHALNTFSSFHSATVNGGTVTVTYLQDIDWTISESVEHNAGVVVTVLTEGEPSSHVVYEEVSLEDSHYIRSNKKLSPTKSSRGVFYKNGGGTLGNGMKVSVIPNPGVATLGCNFIKKLNNPSWGYIVVGEKALYNPSNSTDFGLHPAEESNLTNKILELAGIVVNKPGLSEVILRNQAVKEAKENR